MRRGKRRGEKLGGKRQGVGKKRKRRMWRCIPPPSDNGIYYNPSNREIMCDAVHPSNINMLMMISCGIQFRFDGISSSFSVAMGVESFLGFWNREEGGGGGGRKEDFQTVWKQHFKGRNRENVGRIPRESSRASLATVPGQFQSGWSFRGKTGAILSRHDWRGSNNTSASALQTLINCRVIDIDAQSVPNGCNARRRSQR